MKVTIAGVEHEIVRLPETSRVTVRGVLTFELATGLIPLGEERGSAYAQVLQIGFGDGVTFEELSQVVAALDPRSAL